MSGGLRINLDFDATIAAARSASLDWAETMKRIETNMAAEMSGWPPISPEIKASLEAFHAKQAEADLQYRWGHDPLELMNCLPDRWDLAHWIYKIASMFEAIGLWFYNLADRVEG